MKKIIGIYLLLQAVMKGVCLFLSLRSDESFLPVIVLITCVLYPCEICFECYAAG